VDGIAAELLYYAERIYGLETQGEWANIQSISLQKLPHNIEQSGMFG